MTTCPYCLSEDVITQTVGSWRQSSGDWYEDTREILFCTNCLSELMDYELEEADNGSRDVLEADDDF